MSHLPQVFVGSQLELEVQAKRRQAGGVRALGKKQGMQVVEQGGANREPQRQNHSSGAGSHDQQNSSSRGIGQKDKG